MSNASILDKNLSHLEVQKLLMGELKLFVALWKTKRRDVLRQLKLAIILTCIAIGFGAAFAASLVYYHQVSLPSADLAEGNRSWIFMPAGFGAVVVTLVIRRLMEMASGCLKQYNDGLQILHKQLDAFVKKQSSKDFQQCSELNNLPLLMAGAKPFQK
jgi:hypothetical protein